MSDVLAVHGIRMHRSQRSTMQETWHAAVVDGLTNIRSGRAASVTLECAFYGHEYNDGKAVAEPEYTLADLRDGVETELVAAIGRALELAEEEDGPEGAAPGEDAPSLVAGDATKFSLPPAAQRALVFVQRSSLFEGRERSLVAYVKQVGRYLTDPDLRERVLAEFSAAMESRPRAVLAHSLGSVVAYEWLQQHDPDDAPHLITLGSPLGLEAVRTLLPRPPDRSRWPGRVPSWTNVAARWDAVASVKHLAPLYHPDIDDQLCDTPRRHAHSAVEYLRNVRTARALDHALT